MAMIGELATAHPVQVLPQTSVVEAARRMADLGIGDVIVTDESTGEVVGMLTDRDLALRVVAKGLDPATTTVGDVCTHDVTTIGVAEDVSVAEEMMSREAIRRLPVVKRDGTLAGVVSTSDLTLSGYVDDKELRDLLRAIHQQRRRERIGV